MITYGIASVDNPALVVMLHCQSPYLIYECMLSKNVLSTHNDNIVLNYCSAATSKIDVFLV